jgi:hypothetical protein
MSPERTTPIEGDQEYLRSQIVSYNRANSSSEIAIDRSKVSVEYRSESPRVVERLTEDVFVRDFVSSRFHRGHHLLMSGTARGFPNSVSFQNLPD